jgi:hypothetical protein
MRISNANLGKGAWRSSQAPSDVGVPPAHHCPVGSNAAAWDIAGADLGERVAGGDIVELPKSPLAPACYLAIGLYRTCMALASADLPEGAGRDGGNIIAPAGQRAIGLHPAAMIPASADLREAVSGRAGLPREVLPPAGHCAIGSDPTRVKLASADRPHANSARRRLPGERHRVEGTRCGSGRRKAQYQGNDP